MLVIGTLIGVVTFLIGGSEQWSGAVTPIGWSIAAMVLTMFMIPALPGAGYEVRGNGEMFPLNGPQWSLFFEYIGNIIYALFMRRLPTKALAALCLILGALHAWIFVFDLSGYDIVGIGWTIETINFWGGMVRMLFPMTVGMLLARTFKPCKIKGAFWICSALLIAIFAMPYIPANGSISLNSLYEVVCIAFLFPIIVWLAASGNSKGLTAKISNSLGELSYPLYIVHYPLMYLFYKWLIENHRYTFGETATLCVTVVVASMALAYACLKLYDEPVRRFLARKFIK
jgi:peptidoglycan/LPS O-acetylase OafA/YrhL